MASYMHAMDDAFNKTRIAKFFQVQERGSSLSIEIRGSIATFLAMAYALAVNPRIIADSGGTCVVNTDDPQGIYGVEYSNCVEDIKRQLVTGTAISSMVGCILMGLLGNLPVALAPSMSINAYFTYSVVGIRGTGKIKYEDALTAVLIEGIIFVLLAVTGARYALVKLIPEPVRLVTPAAIGAFLAHLGLQTSEGIGMVVADLSTIVTLGGCPPDKRTYMVPFTDTCSADSTTCIPGDAYTCDIEGGIMRSSTTWMGLLGMMIMVILLAYHKKSAFIVGIAFVAITSWFRDTSVTYFPYNELGNDRFDYFKQVVSIEGVDQVFAAYGNSLRDAGIALVTFLYVDFLDTSGTLIGIVSAMGIVDPKTGDFPRARWAFTADAIATIVGSLFGTSPVGSYIESGAGVAAGSRTGITAILCGFYFFLSIFFAPIIASIPPWATGGALIITGALMATSLGRIKWHDITHAFTAFITLLIMPLTYSIAYGLLAGICCWVVLQVTFYLLSLVGVEKPMLYYECAEETDAADGDGREENSDDDGDIEIVSEDNNNNYSSGDARQTNGDARQTNEDARQLNEDA